MAIDIKTRQDIICGGMYRSGTTLIYNLVCDLLEKDTQIRPLIHPTGKRFGEIYVHKLHEDVPNYLSLSQQGPKVIYSYRNILDCLVSFLQRDRVKYEEFNLHNRDPKAFIEWMIELDRKVLNFKGKYLEVRYETEIMDLEALQSRIKELLNINSSLEIEKYEFLQTKKITDGLGALDTNTNYWPHHLGDGKSNKFETFLTKEQIKDIMTQTSYISWAQVRGFKI